MFLFLSSGGKAAVIEYRYRLSEDISAEALEKATRDAVEAFPFFRLKPVIDRDGRLDMAENDAPLPVFKKDTACRSLGSSDTNGYLFRICYDKDEIAVEASHGIGDGRGIMGFSQTLVYYYLLRVGKDVDAGGMLYTKEDIGDKTITDRLLERIREIAPVPEAEEKAYKPFCPTEEKVLQGTPYTKRLVLSWDFQRLTDRIKPLGASPLTFFHDLIAGTMYEYYDVADRTVIADVPVDLREKLASRAQSNFTANISLPIERELMSLSDAERYRILRERLKKSTTIENIAFKMKDAEALVAMLDALSLKGKDMLRQMGDPGQGAPEATRSYLLSNIGLMRLPDSMAKYVTGFDIYFTNLEASPVFTMLTYQNRGMLIIGQNYEETGLVDAVYKKLLAMDVDAALRDDGRIRMDDAAIGGFEVL